MTVDSQIITRVLLHFIQQGIPCLPVHDSVIVPYRHASKGDHDIGVECYGVMQREFKRELGQEIHIDYKGPRGIFQQYWDNPSAKPLSPEWEKEEKKRVDEVYDSMVDDGY